MAAGVATVSPAPGPRLPDPSREFLATLTDVSDRAAAGYGWQHGYLAGLAAAGTLGAGLPFDPVRTPAAIAKVYAQDGKDAQP